MGKNNKRFRIVVYTIGVVAIIATIFLSAFGIRSAITRRDSNNKQVPGYGYNTGQGIPSRLPSAYRWSHETEPNEPATSQYEAQSDDSDTVETEPDESSSTTSPETEPTNDDEKICVVKNHKVLYYIKKGDTLCEISRKTGFSVDALAEKNNIRDVNLIYADSVLVLP